MTPELLWKLGRVRGETLSADGNTLFYLVSTPDLAENRSSSELFALSLKAGTQKSIVKSASVLKTETNGKVLVLRDGQIWQMNADGSSAEQLTKQENGFDALRISPDGKKILFVKDVAVQKIEAKDKYDDLPKANAYVFTDLNYRHWDTWTNGKYAHLFIADFDGKNISNEKDLLEGQPFDVPQKPSGGLEDFIFSPDSRSVIYVTKTKSGKAYAVSTNTDLFHYDISGGTTKNLTEGMNGYDTQPAFSRDGKYLYWLSMKEDGYESDKNDLFRMDIASGKKENLTANWDGTVSAIFPGEKGTLYFLAVSKGTEQLFSVGKKGPEQLTKGQWDISGIVGQSGNDLIVSRTDMNHAAELFSIDLKKYTQKQLTFVNKPVFDKLKMSRVDARQVKTSDGKSMLSWVIYPPDFDPQKKYPVLLYCQGGPQSALSQFYSFRWNFQLMAAQGYIVIAPNRRGMPGHGVEWNRQISGDWGGQVMQDYLSAIDDIAKEPFVDKDRLGCVGASYGGYSAFYLAGIHNNRFKTFIAHDGIFDMRSWYGTTEELWFANHELGGPYWDENNAVAQKTYKTFNPIELVDKWDTPIMIVQGGRDFRVGIEQGLQAFQSAQLKGLKSKLLYLPEENHWVLKPQNAIVWQREFFAWLKETL
ncbi:MAG: S9 family peptidase [Mucilaginibacter polytrichastri]|nr:S9 family peptidase [Mucilaginibacter polytrichastri]